MKMDKKAIIPSIALALAVLVGAGFYGLNSALADDEGNYPPIVQRLVDKFHLNADEVKVVFDEERQERHQERMQNCENRLNQAVADGKITEEQKNKLLEKQSEMRHNRALNREDFKKWAEENGIDLEGIRPMGEGLKDGRHFGGGGWKK